MFDVKRIETSQGGRGYMCTSIPGSSNARHTPNTLRCRSAYHAATRPDIHHRRKMSISRHRDARCPSTLRRMRSLCILACHPKCRAHAEHRSPPSPEQSEDRIKCTHRMLSHRYLSIMFLDSRCNRNQISWAAHRSGQSELIMVLPMQKTRSSVNCAAVPAHCTIRMKPRCFLHIQRLYPSLPLHRRFRGSYPSQPHLPGRPGGAAGPAGPLLR